MKSILHIEQLFITLNPCPRGHNSPSDDRSGLGPAGQSRFLVSVFLPEENTRIFFINLLDEWEGVEVYFLKEEINGDEQSTLEGFEIKNSDYGDIDLDIIKFTRKSPNKAIARYGSKNQWHEWRGWKEQGPVMM